MSFQLSPDEDRGLGIKVSDVCRPCNSEWLESIERRVRPHFERMVGASTERMWLGAEAQADIALWTLKTAMVFSLIGFKFYDEPERRSLYSTSALPLGRPRIWLGAFVGTHAATMIDSRVYLRVPGRSGRIRPAYIVTMTVGHVALQLFDARGPEDLGLFSPPRMPSVTEWEPAMVPIWPPRYPTVEWPPPFKLDDEGLSALIDRWKVHKSGT